MHHNVVAPRWSCTERVGMRATRCSILDSLTGTVTVTNSQLLQSTSCCLGMLHVGTHERLCVHHLTDADVRPAVAQWREEQESVVTNMHYPVIKVHAHERSRVERRCEETMVSLDGESVCECRCVLVARLLSASASSLSSTLPYISCHHHW